MKTGIFTFIAVTLLLLSQAVLAEENMDNNYIEPPMAKSIPYTKSEPMIRDPFQLPRMARMNKALASELNAIEPAAGK